MFFFGQRKMDRLDSFWICVNLIKMSPTDISKWTRLITASILCHQIALWPLSTCGTHTTLSLSRHLVKNILNFGLVTTCTTSPASLTDWHLPHVLSPRAFTKLLKPVFAKLRQSNHASSGYLDDSFLVGADELTTLKRLQNYWEGLVSLLTSTSPSYSYPPQSNI